MTWMCIVAFDGVALFDGVMNDSSPLHELKRSGAGELIQLLVLGSGSSLPIAVGVESKMAWTDKIISICVGILV